MTSTDAEVTAVNVSAVVANLVGSTVDVAVLLTVNGPAPDALAGKVALTITV